MARGSPWARVAAELISGVSDVIIEELVRPFAKKWWEDHHPEPSEDQEPDDGEWADEVWTEADACVAVAQWVQYVTSACSCSDKVRCNSHRAKK